jgi:hypothetical protein
VARRWLSFIGYADEGKNKRKAHFPTDGKVLYTKIFRQTPRKHHDLLLGEGERGSLMNDGRPPAVWMLYAYHLFEIISHLLPVATRLRVRVRGELRAQGKTPTLAAINDRMLQNENHRWQFALSMLDHVMLELVGFVIASALGDRWLSPAPAERALHSGVVKIYNETATVPDQLKEESLLSLGYPDIANDPALIAIRFVAQGIVASLARPEFLESFLASERKSRYVESEQLVRAYVRSVNQYDEYIGGGGLVEWWRGSQPPIAEIGRLLLEG